MSSFSPGQIRGLTGKLERHHVRCRNVEGREISYIEGWFAIAEANADPSLHLIASTRAWPTPGVRWRIYLIKDSPMVQPLTYSPTVVANVSSRVDWLAANQQWWLNQANGQLFAAESGPSSWPRSTSIARLSAWRTCRLSVDIPLGPVKPSWRRMRTNGSSDPYLSFRSGSSNAAPTTGKKPVAKLIRACTDGV